MPIFRSIGDSWLQVIVPLACTAEVMAVDLPTHLNINGVWSDRAASVPYVFAADDRESKCRFDVERVGNLMEGGQRLHPSRSASPCKCQASRCVPMSEYAMHVDAGEHDCGSTTYVYDVSNEGFILSGLSSVLRLVLDARHAQADMQSCCPPYSPSRRRPW